MTMAQGPKCQKFILSINYHFIVILYKQRRPYIFFPYSVPNHLEKREHSLCPLLVLTFLLRACLLDFPEKLFGP